MIELSPGELAGQRIIYSYSGLTPPSSLIRLISRGEAAGVIFFQDNIASPSQIRGVVTTLQKADASPGNPVRAPLLLMVDQEGGSIRRLPGAPLLSEKQIGLSDDSPQVAGEEGRAAGLNLKSVGLNVNLAPVLDVYRSAGDFDDQNGRSYSTDPAVVSTLGANFIESQQDVGVAAVAKHFPGLGAASAAQNTDKRPVTLNVSAGSLTATDEFPYKAAIAAGVRAVMVSWARYPALDPSLPAGFSPAIVDGLLRQRLGFTGVTITDGLEAGALQAFGTDSHKAALAAKAGMDLILCSGRNLSEGEQASAGLLSGLLGGTLSKALFQGAVQRVVDLRFSLGS